MSFAIKVHVCPYSSVLGDIWSSLISIGDCRASQMVAYTSSSHRGNPLWSVLDPHCTQAKDMQLMPLSPHILMLYGELIAWCCLVRASTQYRACILYQYTIPHNIAFKIPRVQNAPRSGFRMFRMFTIGSSCQECNCTLARSASVYSTVGNMLCSDIPKVHASTCSPKNACPRLLV